MHCFRYLARACCDIKSVDPTDAGDDEEQPRHFSITGNSDDVATGLQTGEKYWVSATFRKHFQLRSMMDLLAGKRP